MKPTDRLDEIEQNLQNPWAYVYEVGEGVDEDEARDAIKDLLARVRELEAEKADAWQEGYGLGDDDGYLRAHSDIRGVKAAPPAINPYRPSTDRTDND